MLTYFNFPLFYLAFIKQKLKEAEGNIKKMDTLTNPSSDNEQEMRSKNRVKVKN